MFYLQKIRYLDRNKLYVYNLHVNIKKLLKNVYSANNFMNLVKRIKTQQ